MKVVHCKKEKYDVYIGRPSKWGNPFVIGQDGGRLEVINKYRQWILSQPNLIRDLIELEGKILGCWCKPKICHGDVLVNLVDEFKPDWVSPPGDTIGEIFRDKKISNEKAAELLNLSLQDFNNLIIGKLVLTQELAEKLAELGNGSVKFWLAREDHYRKECIRLNREF